MNFIEEMVYFGNNTMESSSSSSSLQQSQERRFQKQKEDRRRQMASRLSSNRTSSSSSENDDSLVCESVGPINHLKYRRQRSKVLFEKDHHVILGTSPTDKKQIRRRRRRSGTYSGTSPSSCCQFDKESNEQKVAKSAEIKTIAVVHREDEGSTAFLNEKEVAEKLQIESADVRRKFSNQAKDLQIFRLDQEKSLHQVTSNPLHFKSSSLPKGDYFKMMEGREKHQSDNLPQSLSPPLDFSGKVGTHNSRFQLLDQSASLPIRNITSAEMKFLEKNNDSETIFQLETENMLTSRQEIDNHYSSCFPTQIPSSREDLVLFKKSSSSQANSIQPFLASKDDIFEGSRKYYEKHRFMRSLDVPGNEKSKDKLESKVKSGLQGERPKLRTRSSSLTLLDSLSNEAQQMPIFPKPILKKSSEDLKPIPILKHRLESDSPLSGSLSGSVAGGILKRKSTTDSSNETSSPRPDHVRIRSPSQEIYGSISEDGDRPVSRRPILRSRKTSASVEERPSTPEYPQSILKRRCSQEDIDDWSVTTSGANSRSSPEPPHGILKRKLSIGSLGSHSPEGSFGSVSSILRKKSYSQHSSYQGSLEDIYCDGEKIRSILKKRSTVSTDDEHIDNFPERPKSILKGRQSEESLSPQSDPNDVEKHSKLYRDQDTVIRPILKQRDSRDELSDFNDDKCHLSEFELSRSPVDSTPLRRASVPYGPKLKSVSASAIVEADLRRSSSVPKTGFMCQTQKSSSSNVLRSSTTFRCLEIQKEGVKEASPSEIETNSISGIILPKRTIVKHDSLELIFDVARLCGESFNHEANNAHSETKIAEPRLSCTSSCEDLDSTLGSNRTFSRVVIDPVPGGNKNSSPDYWNQCDNSSNNDCKWSPRKPRKNSLPPQRQSVIPPSSVKITSNANLAKQLDSLADRAAAEIKKQKDQMVHKRKV